MESKSGGEQEPPDPIGRIRFVAERSGALVVELATLNAVAGIGLVVLAPVTGLT